MTQPTTEPHAIEEMLRIFRASQINHEPGSREDLESKHGQVWDTQELQQDFTVQGFLSPYCVATRKADDTRGTLEFQHDPRFYFSFEEDS